MEFSFRTHLSWMDVDLRHPRDCDVGTLARGTPSFFLLVFELD